MTEDMLKQAAATRRDALQVLGVMIMALYLEAAIWQDGPALLLGIVAFCLFLMVLISTALFLLEGRICRDHPDPTLQFCRPALGVLGVSAGLFFATGFWAMAVLVLAAGLGLAAYRRRAVAGDFNLIPEAALDLGVIAGLGVALAGAVLVALKAVI